MRTRILAGIAAFVVVPFLLTACGGGGSGSRNVLPSSPGSSSGSQNGRGIGGRHIMDVTANDLHAGGGEAPVWVYNNDQQPVGLASNANQVLASPQSLFGQAPTVGNILYCETGSDFGVSAFDGANAAASAAACADLGSPATGFGGRADPPDFAGTDIAFSPPQFGAYETNRKLAHGAPIEAPLVVGPIDVSYNTSDLSALGTNRLQLSRWTYCAIANGTVTNWDDPAITADNGGVSVAGGSLPITMFYRSDADGFNLTLQRHLEQVCREDWARPYNAAPYQSPSRNAAWKGGKPTENWTGPKTGNFVAADGPDAQLQSITGTSGASGFTDGALAVQSFQLNAAMLQNLDGYILAAFGKKTFYADPELTTDLTASTAAMIPFPGGSDFGFVGGSQRRCIAYIPSFTYTDPIAKSAYPIVEVSYGLFYGTNNGHFADVQALLEYIDTNSGSSPPAGSADQVVELNGEVPLPPIVKSYLNNTVTGGKNPCLQS